MEIADLRLQELKLCKPRIFTDERGYFFETYQMKRYADFGLPEPFVQDNVSYSKKNTLRGLHFQKDPGQAKLVTCLQGEIWDVAVDIRPESPTYLEWEAVYLNDQNKHQLYIPNGFAHGFCVLSDFALVTYKVSSEYDAAKEGSIRWNDPALQIVWPVKSPLLSPRDAMSEGVAHVLGHRS